MEIRNYYLQLLIITPRYTEQYVPALRSSLASSTAAAGFTSNDSSLLAQHNDTINRLKLPEVSSLKSSSNDLPYTG